MPVPRIIVTSGEPAGIGPDTCVMIAQEDWDADLVVAGDRSLLRDTAATLRQPLRITEYDAARPPAPHRGGTMTVLDVPNSRAVNAGRLDVGNAGAVIRMLDLACDGCTRGEFAAMVTAPVQKSTLLDAGYAFSGHTEYLAARTGGALPVMMLVSGSLRVALVTTHLPLREVPGAVTAERVRATLRIVDRDLARLFALTHPRMLVLGLNPHAGESGHLGREELDVIEPVLRELRREGLHLAGPTPADTAFAPHALAQADVVVAMYHDQGLPVLKHAGFGHAVNVTLGLPIIRTSVDHGTALALARSGTADAGSMRAALKLALTLASPSLHAGP